MSQTLVISHDSHIAQQLQGLLEQRYCRNVRVANSFREATAILKREAFGAVFLDVRKSLSGESPAGLLQCVVQAKCRTNLIAISDDGYVRDWAALADQAVNEHLVLPLEEGRIAHLMECKAGRISERLPSSMLVPRVVQGKTVTCKTHTPSMFKLMDDLVTMATHDVTVLLVGETGTGKTTLARLIHELSSRHESRFLDVACGALAPELIESELFGHVKGAFTSADRGKPGKFEVAGEGSLLLDEIDVLGLSQQAKLLRVIETGEFEPVGSNDTRNSKARLIVASNVDLKSLMERELFRADLYYRLSMLECHIPPLRERPHDIVPLTLAFVDEFCSAHSVQIQRVHPDFLDSLKAYHWPGNIRELKNHVRRAVLFCRTGVLTPNDLGPQFRDLPLDTPRYIDNTPSLGGDFVEGVSLADLVARSERRILEHALQEHNDNRTATAKSLKMSRVGLYKKMKKHGLIEERNKRRVVSG